jgi:peptide/nickel transport system ATP-binding protein
VTAPALRVEHLTIRDGDDRMVVADVSFELRPGTALSLIGETGSGKSLVAQAILGLLPRTLSASGTMRTQDGAAIAFDDIGAIHALWARHTMLVPQEPREALDPTMRMGRQISSSAQTADLALASVDLEAAAARLYPFELSGGMAQRAVVAMSLVTRAPVIVADEPTKGLDPLRFAQVGDLMASLLDKGRALVVVTHEAALVRRLGGQVIVLLDGRIVEQGEAADVLKNPRSAYMRDWLAADPSTWAPCERCADLDDPVLAAHGLSAAYGTARPLFADIDLHLSTGGVLAVTGPSGCGKTTLGNVLLGLKAPRDGHVSWNGVDPYKDGVGLRRLRQKYQKLHQDPVSAFVRNRTIRRQLADLNEVAAIAQFPDRVADLLDRLKLKTALLDRHPAELSGGEGQRLALLRLLLLRPRLIVADEPTSRLDPLIQKHTIGLLREIVATDRLGLVLIGHDRALLSATADEVIEL